MSFGFIGVGNMGGALATAVSKVVCPSDIYLSDYSDTKLQQIAESLGANRSNNNEIASNCNFIFLGVKPQMMVDMLSGISSSLSARKDEFVLVTMAAGLSIEKIRAMAGGNYPVIRIMPNTPVSVGEGMVLYTASENVTDDMLLEFTSAMRETGKTDMIPEHLIDAGSVLSGCGPAFVYMFIEALADGGVECGLPRDKALKYAEQTVLGSAKLALTSQSHPGALKDAVCSPGGSTIAGVHVLENRAFRSAAMSAVTAAFDRTKDLGN